ncbi:peptidase associated/transthyretin-like domain-containing protein [Mucilaginibacter pedocola]|uniref:Uncharacterized protein n=1 Tax=Mucilaginibacter pedocola TaxID=1792845 RepID=A0A1S9PCE7_9SPHI|nr:hypothetical protein [Mucilaginibacter pedocola]OOQ58664.1 hypothetical protein BC343_08340 [Mucilaginibacter pedocola]
MQLKRLLLLFTACVMLSAICLKASAQSMLGRNISIHINQRPLGVMLKTMEERGKFYFSYDSRLLKPDSLVSLDADNWTIKEVLDHLLMRKFEYKETPGFIILRYAPLQLKVLSDSTAMQGEDFVVSGFIADEHSGKKLANASVYERNVLQSTLTDANGFFELRLKNTGMQVQLTISKEFYKDTTITFLKDVNITRVTGKSILYYALNDDPEGIETTSLGKLFLSTRQKIQAANLKGLIANAPFQASAIPNVSTHGEMNGQIVNTVSLNAVGGYNAGVDGAELGIIFNLDKGDVRSFQLAGAFNVVGGNVGGVQIAGLYNNVLGSVHAVQVALLHNSVKRNLRGVQLSLYNHVRGEVEGIQVAPIGNIANKRVDGIQMAILGNVASRKFEGIQLGGLFNYAGYLRGLQIGLINIADTSRGFSIGLINIVKNGYHKVTLGANETLQANLTLKSGSKSFYTLYTGGARLNENAKMYGMGMGFGTVMGGGRITLNPEISSRYLYQGTWHCTNLLNRLDANINIRLAKGLALIGGPSINLYYTGQFNAVKGYALMQDLHPKFDATKRSNWFWGWNVGLNLF